MAVTYDVFISYKSTGQDGSATPDSEQARRVYDALVAQGLRVFFSDESLVTSGQGHFSKSIEAALDSACVLVLVASCREHIESKWVEAEWDSFLQDVRSGNKQGELCILNCGTLKPANLPLFLRRQQMFAVGDLDKLVTFVANALPAGTALEDVVKVSLHCVNAEKREDKIYLVATHKGTIDGLLHVTAFWGARTATRLKSQMKAINVTAAEAEAIVKKARHEKRQAGYRAKPLKRILTAEAGVHLRASLSIAEAPAHGAPRKKAAPKKAATSRTTTKKTPAKKVATRTRSARNR